MSAPQKFRSAFNGFNREDVVRYLEYMNARHTAQINQLTGENEYLRARADAAPDVAALEQERDELLEQVADLRSRCAALELQLSQTVPAADAPTMEQELEVYRRAERTERMARERADLIYLQANTVLTDAVAKVDTLAARVCPTAEQVLAQLQTMISAVEGGKDALQEALGLIALLNPNKD